MKKYPLLIFLLYSQSFGQVKYDTLQSIQVTDAVKYCSVAVPSIPWSIHILKIDLTHPHLKIESVKAADQVSGSEPTSAMASRNSSLGHKVIAAVNGDFYYKGGIPTNLQIRNGQVLTTPIARTIIGFDDNNKPLMSIVKFSGKIFRGKSSFDIDGVNVSRNANQLIFFNRYFGESTATNSSGREILVRRINQWFVNDTVKCIVKKIQIGIGSLVIPDTTFAVISAEGSAIDLTKSLRLGDTLKILNMISPGISRIKEAIGGLIRFVNNGQNYVSQSFLEENKPGFTYVRHPRTAIGFSQDTTKLFIAVVDGRQKHSAGMTLPELADLMISVGAYHALNLDGGGSTTMVVKDSLVNSPSDGAERAVSNGLLIISTDPSDDLGQLYFSDKVKINVDKPKGYRAKNYSSK